MTEWLQHWFAKSTMDDLTDIRAFYNTGWETEADRLAHRQLEADITWRYIDWYLPSKGRILDVGFGTGFYSFPLADRGYQITAVDLSDEFVSRCRALADELGFSNQIDFRTGDARILEQVPRGSFDAILLLGPMYHLVLKEDRMAALQSAYDCLKPGAVILSAWLSRFGNFGNFIKKNPSWIENRDEVRWLIEKGRRPDHAPRGSFRGHFSRLEEIAPIHETVGFHTLQIAGIEPAISADDESYNRLEGKTRELWLDLLFEISAEQSIVAASRHILYVGRKLAG